MKNKRALVTGCCGFIGHHLVKALKERGYYVYGIDDLSNGDRKYAKLCDEFVVEDISNVENRGMEYDVDYVFHLAAIPRVPYSIEHPMETHQTNVDGTLTVLESIRVAREEGESIKVIYSSSSSVYGMQDVMPIKEDVKLDPLNPYALQKLTGDHYCKIYNDIYGLPTVALRYFNVYGEDQDGSHPYATVVSKFLEMKKQGKALTIHGDGEQTRDLTYVGDVVEANILAAESDATGSFNIGGGRNYSINEIASIIGGETVSEPGRPGEARDTLADISKAKEILGWEPKMDLATWLKNQL